MFDAYGKFIILCMFKQDNDKITPGIQGFDIHYLLYATCSIIFEYIMYPMFFYAQAQANSNFSNKTHGTLFHFIKLCCYNDTDGMKIDLSITTLDSC